MGDDRFFTLQHRPLDCVLCTPPMPIGNCYKDALRPELFHVTFGNNRDLGRANPCRDVKHLHYATDGYHTWSPDEVKQFEARHKVGTKTHLALALMLYLGVHRGDAVRLGKQHVRNGAVHFVPNKTPFGLWFRARCDVTGLPQCRPMARARPAHLSSQSAAQPIASSWPSRKIRMRTRIVPPDCPHLEKLYLTIPCKRCGSRTRTAILRPRGLFGGGRGKALALDPRSVPSCGHE